MPTFSGVSLSLVFWGIEYGQQKSRNHPEHTADSTSESWPAYSACRAVCLMLSAYVYLPGQRGFPSREPAQAMKRVPERGSDFPGKRGGVEHFRMNP